jgi:hypothetical protein
MADADTEPARAMMTFDADVGESPEASTESVVRVPTLLKAMRNVVDEIADTVTPPAAVIEARALRAVAMVATVALYGMFEVLSPP